MLFSFFSNILNFVGISHVEGRYQSTHFMKFLKQMKSHQWDVKSMKDKDKWVIKLESEKKVANKKELSSNDPCIDLEMKFHRKKWFRSICHSNDVKARVQPFIDWLLAEDSEDDEDERSPSPDHIYVYQADGSLKPCWKGVYGSLPGKGGKYNSREWRKDPPAPASSVENTVYVCKARGVHEGCGMQFDDQVRFHQEPVELENLRRLQI